jgi:hypothetical protein
VVLMRLQTAITDSTAPQDGRERRRAKLTAYWAQPGRREAHGLATRERMADPAVRDRIKQRTAAALSDPDRKARQRDRASRQWADPAVRVAHGALTKTRMARRKLEGEIVALLIALARAGAAQLSGDGERGPSAATLLLSSAVMAELLAPGASQESGQS